MITRKRSRRVLIYTTLILLSMVYLVPAYMLVITSLKSPDQITNDTVWNLPTRWYFQSFLDAWEAFAPSLRNSVSMVIPSTLISALLGSRCLPRTGFSMHQSIMSRSRATRPNCVWNFG